jgi:hypothetical protein
MLLKRFLAGSFIFKIIYTLRECLFFVFVAIKHSMSSCFPTNLNVSIDFVSGNIGTSRENKTH